MFAFPSCMKKLPEHSALGRGVRAAKNIHPRDQTRAGCFNRRLVRLRSEGGVGGVGGQLRLFQVCIDFYSRFKFSEMCLFSFLFLQAFFKVGHIFFFSSKLRWKAALRSHTFARFSTRSQRGLFKNETSSRTAKRPCHHFLQWELI